VSLGGDGKTLGNPQNGDAWNILDNSHHLPVTSKTPGDLTGDHNIAGPGKARAQRM
jgi:hypothetical protein